jgi:hypothetical protein
MLELLFIIACSTLFYFVGKFLFGTKGTLWEGKRNMRVLFGAVGLALVLLLLQDWFRQSVPGAFFERYSYSAEVYVNLFPDGSTTKNYRVPALIEASTREDSDGGSTNLWKVYRLKQVSFPGRGRISFTNSDESLELGRKVMLHDDENRKWEVELTADVVPPSKSENKKPKAKPVVYQLTSPKTGRTYRVEFEREPTEADMEFAVEEFDKELAR